MLHFEWGLKPQYRTPVLLVSVTSILVIVIAESSTGRPFSMDVLYVFPVMLAAAFLPRWATVLLGAGCALIGLHFANLDPWHARIQFGVESVALAGCGLFVAEAFRRARLSEVQERMCALVETGPTAMVTVDARGSIEMANCAAIKLLAPRNGQLIGQPIAGFLPALHYALRSERVREFRTAIECRGHLGNGKPFLAQVWLSTYKQGTTPKLAAIITDIGARPTAS